MGSFTFNNRTAIVTGAGSGINLEFAKALWARGCNILIADLALNAESKAVVESARQNGGPAGIIFQQTDVTEWHQLERMFEVAEREFGTVATIVCPGAGIYEPPRLGFWADTDEASHYKILDVNLVHPLKTTRIAVRRMRQQDKRGVIVHIASVAAQTASFVTPLYQASKHGVDSFVRGMAKLDEMCGIRVVGVQPGIVHTPLLMGDRETSVWVDTNKDTPLHPRVIADALIELVMNEGNKYPAGTMLEVCDARPSAWRIVPMYNNPGPSGPAFGLSKKDKSVEQIEQFLEPTNLDGTT